MSLIIAYDKNGNPTIAESSEARAMGLTFANQGIGSSGMIGAGAISDRPKPQPTPIGNTSPLQQSINIPPQTLGGQTVNPFIGGTVPNPIQPSPVPVSETYDTKTGTQTQTFYQNGQLTEKQVNYGFQTLQTGGSSITSTANKPTQVLPEQGNYYPTVKEKGLGALPQLFLTGAAMTAPGLISTGIEILKTPGEMLKFGSGIAVAKARRAGENFITGWTTSPLETATMTAGSLAFSMGLSKGFSMISKAPIAAAGETRINLLPPKDEVMTLGKGTSTFAAPKINTKIDMKFDVTSKEFGVVDASIERGTMVATTPRNIFSKLTGSKVSTIREKPLGSFSVSTDLTDITQVGGSASATGLKETFKSGSATRSVIESPRIDIYQGFAKSKTSQVVSKITISKNPQSSGSLSGGVMTVQKTASLGKLGTKLSSEAGKGFAQIPTQIKPTVFSSPSMPSKMSSPTISLQKTESKTIMKSASVPISTQKTNMKPISISRQRTEPFGNQKTYTQSISVSVQKSSSISRQSSVSIQKQATVEKLKPISITTPKQTSRAMMPPKVAIVPRMGGIGVSSSSGGLRTFRRMSDLKVASPKKRYTPSVGGIILGRSIKTAPKGNVGVGIRPYVRGKRKW